MAKYEPLTITPEALSALDSLHDDVLKFEGDPELSPFLCVIRRPNADEVNAFLAMREDEQKKVYAATKLVTAISVFPTKDSEEWTRQYSRWPLFPLGISSTKKFELFCGIAGITAEREK